MQLAHAGEVKGDVLANTTSIGMHPHEDASPVSSSALASFELVFDAVYTPMDTRLLQVSWCQHRVQQHSVTMHKLHKPASSETWKVWQKEAQCS